MLPSCCPLVLITAIVGLEEMLPAVPGRFTKGCKSLSASSRRTVSSRTKRRCVQRVAAFFWQAVAAVMSMSPRGGRVSSASTTALGTPTAPKNRAGLRRAVSLRQKRAGLYAHSHSADPEGPQMIDAKDQLSRVVDLSCALTLEVEKARLALKELLKQNSMRNVKLDRKRNVLKVLRRREELQRTMGEQIKKLSISQLENRLNRSTQRYNFLVAETQVKKEAISANRILKLERERIMRESIESIKELQHRVNKSRADAVDATTEVKRAKQEITTIKAKLKAAVQKGLEAEMEVTRTINDTKASELADAVAAAVQRELEQKKELNEQVANAKRAKAVTVAAQMAGMNAATALGKRSDSGGPSTNPGALADGAIVGGAHTVIHHGHREIEELEVLENHALGAASDNSGELSIAQDMVQATRMAFDESAQGFGGLSNEQEEEMKKDVNRHRWKAAGKFANISAIVREKRILKQFFVDMAHRHGVDLHQVNSLDDIFDSFMKHLKEVTAYEAEVAKLIATMKNIEMDTITCEADKKSLMANLRNDPKKRVKVQIIDYRHKNRSTDRQIQAVREERDQYLETLSKCREVVERCFDDPSSNWDSIPESVFAGSAQWRGAINLLKQGLGCTRDPESVMWQEPWEQMRPLEQLAKMKAAALTVASRAAATDE